MCFSYSRESRLSIQPNFRRSDVNSVDHHGIRSFNGSLRSVVQSTNAEFVRAGDYRHRFAELICLSDGFVEPEHSVFITFAIAALPLATSPSPGHMEDGVVLIQIECGGNVTGIKKPSRWRLRATARYGFFRVLGGVHVNPASL